MIKGIIWCKNFEYGCEELNFLIKNYEGFAKVEWYEYRKDSKTVIFNNGDIWEVVVAKQNNGRGKQCNISYIDTSIDKRYIVEVIDPSTISKPYVGKYYY